MEFQDVVRHRRMVRHYDVERPIAPEVVERIVDNGLRAPSAGFAQGWGFLVLDTAADIELFRAAARTADQPERWFAARVEAPLLIVPLANKDAYLGRYAEADKGHSHRSDAWWRRPKADVVHRGRWAG